MQGSSEKATLKNERNVKSSKSDRRRDGNTAKCKTRQNTNSVTILASSIQQVQKLDNQVKIFLGNLAAGAVAGCTVEATLYPIDTIKTRLQMMTSGGGVKALFKGGGLGKLYSGIWGNLVGVGPATALFFGVYEPVKLKSRDFIPNDAAPIVAGAVAGVAASVIRVPTEVIKQRLQGGQFKTVLGAISTIVKQEGVRGFFAGYGAFLLRDLPFDAVEFAAYEALKSVYTRYSKRKLSAVESGVTGATAGAITGLVTTPCDVLKTRLMTQGTSGQYKNLFDAIGKIAKEEGAYAFFKGWQARLLWISIGGCVFFTALEQARNVFVPTVVERETEAIARTQQ
eukprot:g4043.t1